MEIEKLIYTNEMGESLEMSTDSIYHCNVSKDVSGISGVQSVIYSTNSMGQHGDTYVGQRIEARDVDIIGHINTRNKAQALELRRAFLKTLNPELSGTLIYQYGSFKRVIGCRLHGEPKAEREEVLIEFHIQLDCLNPFWRAEEEEREDIASWVPAWEFPCEIEQDNPGKHDFRIPRGKRNSKLLQRRGCSHGYAGALFGHRYGTKSYNPECGYGRVYTA